jgi:hypothetical protein
MPRLSARLLLAATLVLTATPAYIATSTPTVAASQAQRAYDACVDAYNNKYRQLKGPKAIVAGVSNSKLRCFWSSGGSSVSVNIREAEANCRDKFDDCYLWHDSSAGMQSWVKRISDMGGSDGSRENDSANSQALINLLSGAINTLGAINQSQGAGGYNSNGGGNNGYGNSGGSACTPEQIARGWSEERCILN